MDRVPTDDPHVIAFAHGGGIVSVIGCLFFGVWGAYTLATRDNVVSMLFAYAMFCVGGWYLLSRKGVRIDRRNATVTQWWGLLWPMHSKVHQFGHFESLRLRSKVEKGEDEKRTVFPLVIVDTSDRLEIDAPWSPSKARDHAAEIAAFLGLQIIDSSEGFVARYAAEQITRPLRERLTAADVHVDLSAPPIGLRALCIARENTVFFQFPSRPNTKDDTGIIGSAVLVVVSVLIGWYMRDYLDSSEKLTGPALILWCVISAVFVLLAVRRAADVLQNKRVEACPQYLRCTTGLIFKKTSEFAGDELQDIRIDGRNEELLYLRACTNDRAVRFGEGLTEAELEWIRDVLIKAVVLDVDAARERNSA